LSYCGRIDHRSLYKLVSHNSYTSQKVLINITRLVYTLVQGHIRHLEGIPPEIDELAAEALEHFGEDGGEEEPLLRPTVSDITQDV
jgi:hypothetical protein